MARRRTRRMPLGWLVDIFKTDAHHPKVISTGSVKSSLVAVQPAKDAISGWWLIQCRRSEAELRARSVIGGSIWIERDFYCQRPARFDLSLRYVFCNRDKASELLCFLSQNREGLLSQLNYEKMCPVFFQTNYLWRGASNGECKSELGLNLGAAADGS